MLIATARPLFKMLAAINAPCSVNAYGAYFRCVPRPVFKIAFCDLKRTSHSSWLRRNIKSSGKRARFFVTAESTSTSLKGGVNERGGLFPFGVMIEQAFF